MPVSLEEVRTLSLKRLSEMLEAPLPAVARLKHLVTNFEGLSAIAEQLTAADEAIKPLFIRIASESTAQQRTQDACVLIDELFAPVKRENTFPELWQLCKREPPNSWPSQSSLTFRLCARIVELSCELALKCSQREQAASTGRDDAPPVAADLHAANLLVPLLTHALGYLQSPLLSRYQQRVAWYATTKLASILVGEGSAGDHTTAGGVLNRPPVEPSAMAAPSVRKELRLAAGQRIALLIEPESRMSGGEGVTKLSRILPNGDDPDAPQMAAPIFALGNNAVERRVTFDTVSQIVLPWREAERGAVDEVLEQMGQSYNTLKELSELSKRVPSSGSDDRTDADVEEEGVEGGKAGGGRAGHHVVTADEMDVAADRIKIEMKRLQGVSEPLTEVTRQAVTKIEQAKMSAREARSLAASAKDEAEEAAKAAEEAKTAASDSADVAKSAEATKQAAEEKAQAARADMEMADAKVKEITSAAEKAAEAAEQLRGKAGVGSAAKDKDKKKNSVQEQFEKEAFAAAEKAAAAYAGAEAQLELTTSRLQALQRSAASMEEEAQATKAAAEEAEAKSADLKAKASVANFRDALLSAIAIDATALEQAIEAWALAKLRATGAAAVRAYASGQQLVVFDPGARGENQWVDVVVTAGIGEVAAAEQEGGGGGGGGNAPPTPDPAAGVGGSGGQAGAAADEEDSFRGGVTDSSKSFNNSKSFNAADKKGGAGGRNTLSKAASMLKRSNTVKGDSMMSAINLARGGRSNTLPTGEVASVVGSGKASSTSLRSQSLQTLDNGRKLDLVLHPWNHGPADMPAAKYNALKLKHARTVKAQHATIVDSLTGRRLDVLDQCVPVEIAPAEGQQPLTYAVSEHKMSSVTDVASLAAWLSHTHAMRCRDGSVSTNLCVLLTAGPASGKTCLMSQLVTHVLKDDGKGHLVPVVLRVQKLQRMLSNAKQGFFARSWNWVDAYLQAEYGVTSDQYFMLRQAMASRRALLLIDGIDEGGRSRAAIERHVTKVLAMQGHPMLVTSRPAGLVNEAFAECFHRLRLLPLTDAQQRHVTQQRAGSGCEPLLRYIDEKVPLDAETGERVTGNPLMLSVVISIYESRQHQPPGGGSGGGGGGVSGQPDEMGGGGSSVHGANALAAAAAAAAPEMPETTMALYDLASKRVLEREGLLVLQGGGGAAASSSGKQMVTSVVPYLTALLQATFFEAHAAQRRVIELSQLEEAALGLVNPQLLTSLRSELPPYAGRAEGGHYVEVLAGPYMGRRGVVSKRPFRVTLDDGTLTEMLREADFRTSGLSAEDGRAFERTQRESRGDAVAEACEELPAKVREALSIVRARVLADKLPLLSLLQVEPLQVQSSHLSFQEYYCARAIRDGRPLPSSSASPWRWEAWWHNTLKLGSEMGEAFGAGLVKATGQSSEHIELNGKIGGHRPTGLLAVSQLMRGAASVNIANNKLTCNESLLIADGLRLSTMLTTLSISNNRICGVWFDAGAFKGEYTNEGLLALAAAIRASPCLTKLDVSQNCLGVAYVDGVRVNSMAGIIALTEAIGASASLHRLVIGYNSLGPTAGAAVGTAFAVSKSLCELDISGNLIGLKGGKAICEAALSNLQVRHCDMRFNSFDEKTKEQLKEAENKRKGLQLEM